MKDYVKRMVEENRQLQGRIARLEEAISSQEFMANIGEKKSDMLMAQYHVMKTYACILGLRLEMETCDAKQ